MPANASSEMQLETARRFPHTNLTGVEADNLKTLIEQCEKEWNSKPKLTCQAALNM
ncbi:hypothetical protein MASR1M12_38770 [Erysipelotrichia bacterium]